VLRHVADELTEFGAPTKDVQPHDLAGAACGFQQTEEELDEGALAGAVGAHEADDARLQLKV
jgi:hypothetical protein